MTRSRRTLRRWNDDFGSSRRAGIVDRQGVISRVRGETFNVTLDALDEIKSSLRVVSASVSQSLGDDDARTVNTEMKLLPATPAAAPILGCGPFAFADRDAVEALLIEAGWSEPEFAPLDYAMVVGAGEEPLDDALAYLLRIGPLARYLADLDTAGHNAAITRLRRILAMHEHDGLVAMGASAWIVTAHNPL